MMVTAEWDVGSWRIPERLDWLAFGDVISLSGVDADANDASGRWGRGSRAMRRSCQRAGLGISR